MPRLAAQWKWTCVRDLLLAGAHVTWFIVRAPDVQLYSNATFRCAGASTAFDTDISASLTLEGQGVIALALRDGDNIMVFVGNASSLTVTAAVALAALRGSYASRQFNSLRGHVGRFGRLTAAHIKRGVAIELESQGFCLLELRQDV